MLDRIKETFVKPLAESVNLGNYTKLEKEDMRFIQGIGNYMYDKFSDSGEQTFKDVIISAQRNSFLFDLLRDESRRRLKNQTEVFALIDHSKYDEQIGPQMLRRICIYPDKIMNGSLDPSLLVDFCHRKQAEHCIVGSFDLDPKTVILFVPCVLEWFGEYAKENKLTPMLQSVRSAIEEFKWKKEVITIHDPQQVGEIVHAE
jgi:hypothetical protein